MPRNYGDPAAEYHALRSGAGLVDRGDRALVRAFGRDPVRMVDGLITNDLAGAPAHRAVFAAALTAKGRMVTELRALRPPGDHVLLDVPRAALDAFMAHLKKFVPPLFARFEDASAELAIIGLYGPAAREKLDALIDEGVVELPAEDAVAAATAGGAELLVIRTLFAGVDGYDILVRADAARAVWRRLADVGARPVGHGPLDVVRIEAGRPRWTAELDGDVIPLEAGLLERAISTTKGCYTGQEVIVRILHRGHVNWELRGFMLGEAPGPHKGTPLVRPTDGKVRGRVTSACYSPRYGQTIALGYAHRDIEPPDVLLLGDEAGGNVLVLALPFPEPDTAVRPEPTGRA